MSDTSKPADGGQAFPRAGSGSVGTGACDGMTLRDYFAAWAMHAELATAGALPGPRDAFIEEMIKHGHTAEQHLAFCAYMVADAMLVERAK